MSIAAENQGEILEELRLNRSDGSMVTIPADMFDRMASIYYLWRAGLLQDVRKTASLDDSTVLDQPAVDETNEEEDRTILVQGPRAGVSPEFVETSQEDLDAESNDANPND